MLELNQVYFGDCLEVMKDIPDGSIDMVLADPPYGKTACKWDSVIPIEPMWEHLERVVKKNAATCVFGSEPFSSLLRISNLKNYKYDWIWNKKINGAFTVLKFKPGNITENISIFSYGRTKYYPIMTEAEVKNIRPRSKGSKCGETIKTPGGVCKTSEYHDETKRYPVNLITYSKYNAECNQIHRLHPSQKPVALMEYMIKTYTDEGDTVLDYCCGSGTTGVACKNLNRNYILIEKEPEYVDIARERIGNHTVQLELVGAQS